MKPKLHPKYVDATVTCGCGNTFKTRSTISKITVEICSACHPFYTGKQKYVDTAGMVEKFQRRYAWSEEKAAELIAQSVKNQKSRKKARKVKEIDFSDVMKGVEKKKAAAAAVGYNPMARQRKPGGRGGPRRRASGEAPQKGKGPSERTSAPRERSAPPSDKSTSREAKKKPKAPPAAEAPKSGSKDG